MVLDVIRALGRRWYVVLAGLLLTAGMVFGAYKASPPEYSASGLVLLLPPRSDIGKGGNPFLELSGLEQPASIVATYLSSAPVREEIETVSAKAQYEVALDASTRGPVLAVHVTDESSEGALTTVAYLLKRIPEELSRLQDEVGARGGIAIGSMELTVDHQAEVDTKGTVRIMIAAAVAGLVGTGFAAVGMDGFMQRRRFGRGSKIGAVQVDGTTPPPRRAADSSGVGDSGSGIAAPIPLTRSSVRHER